MHDARGATVALLEAVRAARDDDWTTVAEALNSHKGLNPCAVCFTLARIIVCEHFADHDGPEGTVRAEVFYDETVAPDEVFEAETVAACIAAAGNEDTDGVHHAIHTLDMSMTHRVVCRLLVMAAEAIEWEEDRARNN